MLAVIGAVAGVGIVVKMLLFADVTAPLDCVDSTESERVAVQKAKKHTIKSSRWNRVTKNATKGLISFLSNSQTSPRLRI